MEAPTELQVMLSKLGAAGYNYGEDAAESVLVGYKLALEDVAKGKVPEVKGSIMGYVLRKGNVTKYTAQEGEAKYWMEKGYKVRVAYDGPQGMFAASEAEPFSVKHYVGEDGPIIKGNGFDNLRVGEDRQEAEQFVAWINQKLGAKP